MMQRLKCFFGYHRWIFGWARVYDDTGHKWYEERICRCCGKRETRDTY